jgi:short-subunit dehydrogenase
MTTPTDGQRTGVRTALITGGSVGIGRAFADRLAADGYRLVLVARDTARLDACAAELVERGAPDVAVLPADLLTDEGRARVEARLADAAAPIDLLVNNAGFGLASSFVDNPVEVEERLLDIHVRATLRLTHAALPAMLARGSGAVINVASTAAFVPRGTYSAAKAWMVLFTEGLAAELQGTGVTAMALCPGFTHTEFHQRAGVETADIPGWMWQNAPDVVEAALRDLRRGVPVSIPGARYKALIALSRVVPRSLSTRVGRSRSKRW